MAVARRNKQQSLDVVMCKIIELRNEVEEPKTDLEKRLRQVLYTISLNLRRAQELQRLISEDKN